MPLFLLKTKEHFASILKIRLTLILQTIKETCLDAVLAELETLDNTSKLQIVQERRLLAEAGHISYADLLPVLDKLAKEESLSGWFQLFLKVISALERFIDEGTEAESL